MPTPSSKMRRFLFTIIVLAVLCVSSVFAQNSRDPRYKPAVPSEHYKLIVEATWEKVEQNPEVKKVLLSTGDLILKPDHHQEPNAPAAWRYYEILIEIRSELQKRH